MGTKHFAAYHDKRGKQERIRDIYGVALIETVRGKLCSACTRRDDSPFFDCLVQLLPITTDGKHCPYFKEDSRLLGEGSRI